MTSSSSLYGTVTQQNVSSTNSTSLYGEAGTPIPDSGGNVVVRGDLYVLSGNILTTATTGNIFPANATTINLGNAATTVNIGAGGSTTNFGGNVVAQGGDFGNITIGIADDQTITTTTNRLVLKSASGEIDTDTTTILSTNSSSFNLLNSPTTINAFQGATTLTMGANTGTTTIRNNLVADSGDFGNITIGVVDANTIATTSGDINLTPTGNNGVNITSGSDAPTLITRNSAVTNTSIRGLALSAQTSLTPAVGFGNTLEYQVEAQPGNTERAGYISVNLTDITAGSEDFSMYFGLMENGAAYTSKMVLDSTGSLALDNDLTIGGTSVNLAQDTGFLYSENNNRLNRPYVQSTTGNTSGWRVRAPNATTSAIASLSVASTNDASNNTFLSIQARGSATDPLRIATGTYTANVLGPSGDSITFVDGSTTYATVNPAGPTIGTDLTTKAYVDALPANITYTIDSSTTTGGANFNLAGSDSTIDTIKFANGSNVTVTATDANTITIAATDTNTTYNIDATSTTGGANLNLNGSDSTVDPVAFKGSGATTVTRTDANTITVSSTDTNTTYTQDVSSTTGGANLNLVGSDLTTDSVKFAGGTNVSIVATDASTMTINATDTNTTYDFNATSTTGGANLNLVGSDSTTDTVKVASGTGITVTQDSATQITVTNAGVTSAVAGTGIGVSGATGAVTISNTGVTSLATGTYLSVNASTGAVTVSTNATDANTPSTIVARDASGNFSASGATLGNVTVGVDTDQVVSTSSGNLILQTAAGTNAGTVTLTAGANGAITLAPNGTGNVVNTFSNGGNLTNNRNYVFGAIRNSTTQNTNGDIWELNTSAAQSVANPYYRGVSLDNSADTTRGPATVMRSYSGGAVAGSASRGRVIFEKARGTAASPTAVQNNDILGSIDVTGYTSTGWLNDTIPSVAGFFGFAAIENWVSNTNLGTNFTLTLAPTATTVTSGANLTQVLNLNPQSAAHRADTYTFGQGKTGTATYLSMDSSKITAAIPIKFPTYTAAAANAITGAVGWQISISDSPTVGGRMAFWDTTNARWSYISDNSAV